MNKIQKAFHLIRDIPSFGTIPILDLCINHGSAFLPIRKRLSMARYKTEKINQFIKKNISLSEISYTPCSTRETVSPRPIFFCWWQGKDKMPLIPQLCYKKVLQYANRHPVIFISEANYQDYISIPGYVKKAFEEGRISITHLSDIVRLLLLAKHGGIWLDSTILLKNVLDEKIFSYPWWSIKFKHPVGFYVSQCRWTGFCIASAPDSQLLEYISQALCLYWKTNERLIDFFLIDYIINYAYETNSHFKKTMDQVPPSNPELYAMTPLLIQDYSQDREKCLFRETDIFKLNRHIYTEEQLKCNRNSVFWHLYQE